MMERTRHIPKTSPGTGAAAELLGQLLVPQVPRSASCRGDGAGVGETAGTQTQGRDGVGAGP